MNQQEATEAVERELYTTTGMWECLWEAIPMDDLDSFTAHAKRTLGDKTEIEGEALRKADWPALYTASKVLR